MAGKSYKYVTRNMKIEDAVSSFYADIEELASEARDIVENATEALAQTSRIQTFEATADTLENLQASDTPQLPEALQTMEITVGLAEPRNRRQSTSRAVRCENAAGYARAVIDAVREWCDEVEAEEDIEKRPGDDVLTELREWTDELEGHVDEAEATEFPGMYG